MKGKKMLLVTALVTGLSLTGLYQASARGWGGGMGGGGGYPCLGYGGNYQMMDEATQAKIDAFRAENQDLRKQIAMKQAEKRALMVSQTPDPAAVARVEGDLFDLRTEMQNRANEAGLPMMGRGGFGPRGMRGGPGWSGRGMGYGMGNRMGPCFNPQAWN